MDSDSERKTKPVPYSHEFAGFLNELAHVEPWASATESDEVGRWVQNSFDILERTLLSIANAGTFDMYAWKMRPLIRAIIRGAGTVREKHERLHRLIIRSTDRQ
ncbi:MAG: hypothetical protein WAK55_03885 [Xanthobacteraceae bacterium]